MSHVLTARVETGREEQLERELEALSGEILHCYEEINVLYRLCEAVRDVFDERGVLERVLQEVGRSLHAQGGWLVMIQDDGRPTSPMPLSDFPSAGDPQSPAGDGSDPRSSGLTISHLALRCMDEERIVAWDRDPIRRSPPIMAVPLQGADGPLGALVFEKPLEEEAFRSGERQLAGAVASWGATVVQNRRLARRLRIAEQTQNEIEVARRIQHGLLPAGDPSIDGLDVSGTCLPAHDIGGDYFGYAGGDANKLLITIADVSGHGIGAAIGMAIARSTIQSEADGSFSPARILGRVNGHVHRDLPDPGMFVTAFLLAYDARTGRIHWASAGHPPPLLHRAADGSVDFLEGEGLGLGIERNAVYQEHSMVLEAGDALVLYTDGIIDTRDASSRKFGAEGLLRGLRASTGRSAKETVSAIVESAVRWRGGEAFSDDVTLVVVRRTSGDGN